MHNIILHENILKYIMEFMDLRTLMKFSKISKLYHLHSIRQSLWKDKVLNEWKDIGFDCNLKSFFPVESKNNDCESLESLNWKEIALKGPFIVEFPKKFGSDVITKIWGKNQNLRNLKHLGYAIMKTT